MLMQGVKQSLTTYRTLLCTNIVNCMNHVWYSFLTGCTM